MKKYFLYLMCALAITACTNDELTELVLHEECNVVVTDSFYVPYETALKHALEAIDNGNTATTRSASPERRVASHYEYVANKMTRSANDGVEVRFHVINFEDNQGFALVSADSRTTPVYAYSETGNIDIDDAIENSGFGDFMAAAEEFYMNEIIFPTLPDTIDTGTPTPITPVPENPILHLPVVEVDGVTYYLSASDVLCTNPGGILVDVQWNQVWPYNYYCERNENADYECGYRDAAGCGPVAAGQIMSYFRYPETYNGVVFDWNLILSFPYYYEPYSFYERCSEEAKATSKLLKEIGVCAETQYGVESGMPLDKTDDMFRNFGYLCDGPSNFTSERVKSSLDLYGPVYMVGGNSEGYHAWVIDAYRQTKTISIYYHSYEPYSVAFTTTSMDNVYYHCNWGWGPNGGNTWFLDVFDGYSNNKTIIYNIRPNN